MANSIKKHIPNAVTCLNLLSGCVGILFALQGEWKSVAWTLILSGLFDFFDGLLARILGVHSAIGKELDSLADVISFGLLPGMIYFTLLKGEMDDNSWLPYMAFFVPTFSALRLAKFNLDERQTVDFIGLNTPMNAFFTLSLPFISQDYPGLFQNGYVLLACIALSSVLLISEFRLFSMKLGGLQWSGNEFRFIFVILSLVLIYLLKFVAVPAILVLYFILSYLHFNKRSS